MNNEISCDRFTTQKHLSDVSEPKEFLTLRTLQR